MAGFDGLGWIGQWGAEEGSVQDLEDYVEDGDANGGL